MKTNIFPAHRMAHPMRALFLIGVIALLTACNQKQQKQSSMVHEQPKSENAMMKAMDESMMDMHKAKQTGNADYDFAAMMIPHHEGAIKMAGALAKESHSPALISFAKQVIAAQQKEIGVLKNFIQTADQQPSPKAEAFRKALNSSMEPMMEGMSKVTLTNNVDSDFVNLMIPHHQSAVAMAKAYLPFAGHTEIKKMADEIIKTQEAEISWLKKQQ